MTATDARTRLQRLHAERAEALAAGLGGNGRYMHELQSDIAAAGAVFTGLAVTEIATLRAQLGGRQVG